MRRCPYHGKPEPCPRCQIRRRVRARVQEAASDLCRNPKHALLGSHPWIETGQSGRCCTLSECTGVHSRPVSAETLCATTREMRNEDRRKWEHRNRELARIYTAAEWAYANGYSEAFEHAKVTT